MQSGLRYGACALDALPFKPHYQQVSWLGLLGCISDPMRLRYWNVVESVSPSSCKVCLTDNFVASASYLNPLEWVREKLAPGQKEQQSKEEIDAAKKKAAAEGQTSIFDSVASTAREVSKRKDTDGPKKPKKPRSTSVGFASQPLLQF